MSNNDPLLVCLVGPAGGGKTTIRRMLLDRLPARVRASVSVTSRPPRAGEIQGVSYEFVSRDDFQSLIQQGALFEWEETHGQLYGTRRSALESCGDDRRAIVFDIDIRGACTLKRAFPERTLLLFVVPPDGAALKRRLRDRGGASEAELITRLETARREYQAVLDIREYYDSGSVMAPGMRAPDCQEKAFEGERVDYLIVNDSIEDAYALVVCIIRAEEARFSRVSMSRLQKLCSVE